jgi:alcohol dehydrogenase class IV
VIFGPGKVSEAAGAARGMGNRALVVTGRSQTRAACLIASLDAVAFSIPGEPTLDVVRDGVETARRGSCDIVIAIGGGSAIDGGKAIAALLTNPGDPLDYLEVIGAGRPLTVASAPMIAIPTTAGTGSEVTRNAVLASTQHRVKASLRSVHMLPRLAIIDPDLTLDLPPEITASTGLDALTQLIEPYVSVRANAMTDLFCLDGMRLAARSLPRAFADGHDREARSQMAWASFLGGLALSNAGLGAVHGFAAPIGGMFPAPHGAVCAAVLPPAMAVNLAAARERAPGMVARYEEIARIVTGAVRASAEDGVRWIGELCARLGIRPLRHFGVTESAVPELVAKAAAASSMKSNPLVLTQSELTMILLRAI